MPIHRFALAKTTVNQLEKSDRLWFLHGFCRGMSILFSQHFIDSLRGNSIYHLLKPCYSPQQKTKVSDFSAYIIPFESLILTLIFMKVCTRPVHFDISVSIFNIFFVMFECEKTRRAFRPTLNLSKLDLLCSLAGGLKGHFLFSDSSYMWGTFDQKHSHTPRWVQLILP